MRATCTYRWQSTGTQGRSRRDSTVQIGKEQELKRASKYPPTVLLGGLPLQRSMNELGRSMAMVQTPGCGHEIHEHFTLQVCLT